MADKTFSCPITIGNTGAVVVACRVEGTNAPEPVKVKNGDTFVWLRGDQNVQTFTLKFYQDLAKTVPCSAPPFKKVSGSPTNSVYYSGEITRDCGKTVSYSVDATKPDGSVVHYDPIIIIEYFRLNLQVLTDPVFVVSVALVALGAYLFGRRRSG